MSKQLAECNFVRVPLPEFLALEKTLSASIDLLASIEDRHVRFFPEIGGAVDKLTERLNAYRKVAQPDVEKIESRLNRKRLHPGEKRSSKNEAEL